MKLPTFFHRRFLTIAFAISFALVIVGLAISYVNLGNGDRPLILHFDIFRGIDFFGSTNDVLSIGFIGLGILIINLLLAMTLMHKEPVLPYFIASISLVIALFTLIALVVIFSVN